MMIVYEARWLSVLPILVSVGLGYLFSYGVLAAYSDLTQEVTGEPDNSFLFPVGRSGFRDSLVPDGSPGCFWSCPEDGKTSPD